MNFREYQTIDAVNFSSLKHMAESPMAYDWHKENPTKATPAMDFGTAFHAAVLEPDKFAAEYVVVPDNPYDGRSVEGKKFKAEKITPILERVEAEGLLTLSAADMAKIDEMARNFHGHPLIAPFLDAPGKAEFTLTWKDAETGILCKGRLDRLLDDGRIFGIKTTAKLPVRQFQSHAWELFYHAQWAFYFDGAVTNGITPPEVAEGVISTAGPYDRALYLANEDILRRGREAYRGWLRALAVCRERNEWPGQYPDAIVFQAPAWAGTGEFDLEHSIGAFVDALKKEVI